MTIDRRLSMTIITANSRPLNRPSGRSPVPNSTPRALSARVPVRKEPAMPRPIEPPPSRGRARFPDATPEALAWIVERVRQIIDDRRGQAIGWEWLEDEDDLEPDPENNGPVARVFDARGNTV
jgi:hypothetical protein